MKKNGPYEFTLPLNDEHLVALGKLVAQAAYTEALLEPLIADVLGIKLERIRSITVPLSMTQRINLLFGLTHTYLDPEENKKFANLIGNLRGANSDRNDAVHAFWVDVESEVVATKHKYDRGKVNFKSRNDLTPKKLDKISATLDRAWSDIAQFVLDTKPSNRSPYTDTLAAALRAYEQKPQTQGSPFLGQYSGEGIPGLLSQTPPSEE